MKALSSLTLALALALAPPAHAGHLPDAKAAEAALWASPMVVQARGEFAAQALKSQGLQRGREEWLVGADVAQRRIDDPRDTQGEWGVALSRPLRLPARAEAERGLAGALTAHAEASLGEAMHESGRQLLALWFEWLSAAGQAQVWSAHTHVAEQQLAAVNSRIRLGEAPRAERVAGEAALAQVRLQQQQAAARAQQARGRLQAQFPGLPVGEADALPPPLSPQGSADQHADAVLAHNHELFRARRQADVLQAEARQLAARRNADPSLGVFYRNEAGGNEHVLGLNVGVTLPGAARRLDQQAAEQLSTAAQAAALALEARLRQEARADFEAAVAQVAIWQQAEHAAQGLEETARLAARAYSLGEGSLDQVLANRRLALDGRAQAQQARVAALAAQARLQLDAHQLWALDVDADEVRAHP